MDYSTIIDTFVISEMNAKAKLEAKSKQSRITVVNYPSSVTISTSSSPAADKVQFMSDQRSLLRARLELEVKDQTSEIKGGRGFSTCASSSMSASSKHFSHTPRNQGQRPTSSIASTHSNSGTEATAAAAAAAAYRSNKSDLGLSEMAYLEEHLAGIKIKQVKALRRQTRSDLLDVGHQHSVGSNHGNGSCGGQSSNHCRTSIGSLQDVGIEDLFEKRKSLRNSSISGGGHGSGYQGHGQGWGRHRRGSNDSLEMPCANNRRFSKMK